MTSSGDVTIGTFSVRRAKSSGRDELFLDGIAVHTGDQEELAARLESMVATHDRHVIVTLNVAQLEHYRRFPEVRELYRSASIVLLDGMPLVLLARLLGCRGVHRHTGADLLPLCTGMAGARRWRILITGGKAGTSPTAAEKLRAQFPGTLVEGLDFPILKTHSSDESRLVIEEINSRSPQVVFLGLSGPKQELWLQNWSSSFHPTVIAGTGAAADFIAGVSRRAPMLVQKVGLEWVWRLLHEPRRLARRYLVGGVVFAGFVFRALVDRRRV